MQTDKRLSTIQNTTCGVLSGIVTRTVTAPIDVLKISTQIGIRDSKFGLQSLITHIYKQDGPRGFFKGNLISCFKILPYSAVQYIVFFQLKRKLSDDLGRLKMWSAAAAGTSAAVTASIVTYPLDLVKTRFIAQPFDKTKSVYKSIYHAYYKIITDEGVRKLYRGLSVTLAANVPFAAATFMTYEFLGYIWKDPKHRISPVESMIQGTISATVAMTVTFPFDVIRRTMQAQSTNLPNNGGVDIFFTNARECFRQIHVTGGVEQLWRGLLPALVKIVPYYGVMFICYEICKRWCLIHNGYSNDLFQDSLESLDQNIDLEELKEIADYDVELNVETVSTDTMNEQSENQT